MFGGRSSSTYRFRSSGAIFGQLLSPSEIVCYISGILLNSVLNVWTLANVAKISNITGWSWGGVGFQRRWRHSPGLFLWGELLFQVNLVVDGESGILLQHHYRETVRDGWVSEVSEGQFPYLYFWPCWQLADYCQRASYLTSTFGLADNWLYLHCTVRSRWHKSGAVE